MTVTAVSPAAAGIAIGDFFVSSWGYEQTNVDFYQVVGLTPKGVKIQAWTKVLGQESPHASADYFIPGEAADTITDWSNVDRDADYWTQAGQKVLTDAPVVTKRLSGWTERDGTIKAAITLNSFSSASKWDGQPQYQTGAGYGH